MSIKFVNREEELNLLNKRFDSGKPEFIVLYGRRRVGKTELIKFLQNNKAHIYYLCDKTDDKEQLDKILTRTSDFFSDRKPEIKDWEDFFSYLSEKVRKRLIFAIDEFPYLIKVNKAIPSIFQKGWDEYLKNTKIFLILCGSSVSMMEDRVLSYRSPLYGRRTGQLKIERLHPRDAIKFFPRFSFTDKINAYSMLGGIPFYLNQFGDKISFLDNVKSIFSIDSILYEEPNFLLREELREPSTYSQILGAVSSSATKLNEIATKTGIDIHKLPKYLGVLIGLGYVERVSPVTVKKPKSKQTIYRIKDNFFRFWYRYVYPNKSDIESGEIDKIMNYFKSTFNHFVGKQFEEICKEFILIKRPLNLQKLGLWWGHYRDGEGRKEIDIDLVGLNEETKQILFAECKWRDRIKPEKVLNELKEKAGFVDWNKDNRKEHYCIIAKSFRDKDKPKPKNCLLFDLKDMERAFR